MPIVMTADTRCALGADAVRCDSRSLYFDRFADPAAKDKGNLTPRKDWFHGGISRKPLTSRIEAWRAFSSQATAQHGATFFAQAQSRLLINMAGGVMENAGLCLDRFGVPYIPGSAVKGCTRRMAILDLLEARIANESTEVLTHLLADICFIFGWVEQDWKTDTDKQGNIKSDLVYAIGTSGWPEVMQHTGRLLLGEEAKSPMDFGAFAGAVAFLQAYPKELGTQDLELDVLTCHHSKYYEGKLAVALDTEEPNPVMFPAVTAGVVFQFAVLPMRSQRDCLSQPDAKCHMLACEWLRRGLATFGLGAKTTAGYGWFDSSDGFNTQIIAKEREIAEAAAARLKADKETAEADAILKTRKVELELQRSSLTPDDSWIAKFTTLPESTCREIINKFAFSEEKWWPTQGELADERIQFSLLHFLLHVEPEFLAADRANAKSKTAKAIGGLIRRFPAPTASN